MEFYNESVKNRYLNSIENEGSRHVISYIFKASKSTEELLERDLYNFNQDQISEVLKNMSFQTLNSANANTIHIRTYINWCIKMGYRSSNLNPLAIADRKWASQFVDRTRKIHYSLEELEDLIKDIPNDCDKSMLMLWFSGVSGKQFSELRNLTEDDIDWNTNTLTLTELDGSQRDLTVSDRCMELLEKAREQKFYITNGKFGLEEMPLCQSKYIFRNIDYTLTQSDMVSVSVIYSRLTAIKEENNLQVFSQKGLWQSGQIHMAYEIFIRDGHFGDKSQWYEIGSKYNVSKVKFSDKIYPNVSLMKNYINTQNLKELYDIEVDIKVGRRSSKK